MELDAQSVQINTKGKTVLILQMNLLRKQLKKYGDEFDYSKTDLNDKDENGMITITSHKICIDGQEYGDIKVNPKTFLYRNFKLKHFLNTDYFIRISNFVHNYKYSYSKCDLKHKDKDGKVTIICTIHGEFKQNPHAHLKGDGCVLCRNTQEGIFYNEFKQLYPNVEIIRQKHFDWLGRQSLDFYLPQYNIAIEYQGNIHFEYNEKIHKKDSDFESQQERDQRKNELCKINGIRLIYFSFDCKRKEFLTEKIYNKVIELKHILL